MLKNTPFNFWSRISLCFTKSLPLPVFLKYIKKQIQINMFNCLNEHLYKEFEDWLLKHLYVYLQQPLFFLKDNKIFSNPFFSHAQFLLLSDFPMTLLTMECVTCSFLFSFDQLCPFVLPDLTSTSPDLSCQYIYSAFSTWCCRILHKPTGGNIFH